MTINVKGPDGSNFAFPDGTDSAVISDAMGKHYGGAATAADEPVTVNKVVRSAATGVPLVGGALNQLNAATNATLAPMVEPFLTPSADDISRPGPSTERIGDIQLPGKVPTWAERRARSLEMQNKGDEKFAAAHPYIDTAAKITGGVAGSIPAMMAAPAAFGLTGTMGQMITRGAASNAALGGADAMVRGESPMAPALIGGLVGAGAPLAARGVGKLWNGIQEMRNPTAPVPQFTQDIAGVKVRMDEGRATMDPAKQADAEIARSGAGGVGPQKTALEFDAAAKAEIDQATANIGAMMDPAAAPGVTPKLAAEGVQSEMIAREAVREAEQAAKVATVGAEGESLARGLGGGAAPVSAFDAAGSSGAAVAERRAIKEAEKNAAYKARDAVEGEWSPEFTGGLAADVRKRIATGDASERIHIDSINESTASKAIKIIDDTVGDGGLFRNAAAPRASAEETAKSTAAKELADTMVAQGIHPEKALKAAAAAHGIPVEAVGAAEKPPVVDLRALDDARKQLSRMYGDAKSAAFATGKKEDLRAMARILHEFDNAVSDGLANGHFSGDAKMAKELQDAARKSFSEFKQTFSSRGPGDEIGRAVEKILGRYVDTAATPEQIMALSYGPKGNPGTGNTVKVAGRLEKILSPEEYGQWKSGLFKYVDDAELAVEKRAKRIDDFLKTSLAKSALTPDDRAAMSVYSKNLRATAPGPADKSSVARDVSRIAGTDGKPAATLDEVSKMIRANNGDTQRLMVALKKDLTPESWAAVKREKFETLITPPERNEVYTALKKAQNLEDYLGNGISNIVNTPAELAEMAKLARYWRQSVPLPNTVNTSNSATVGAKLANKAGQNVMKMLGFAHGGLPGLVIGHGADVIKGVVSDARAAKETTRLFFGPQAKRSVKTSRVPALVLPSAVEASQR